MAAVRRFQTGRNRLAAVSAEIGLRIQLNKNVHLKRKILPFFIDIKYDYYNRGDANTHKVYAYSTEKQTKYTAIRVVF